MALSGSCPCWPWACSGHWRRLLAVMIQIWVKSVGKMP